MHTLVYGTMLRANNCGAAPVFFDPEVPKVADGETAALLALLSRAYFRFMPAFDFVPHTKADALPLAAGSGSRRLMRPKCATIAPEASSCGPPQAFEPTHGGLGRRVLAA